MSIDLQHYCELLVCPVCRSKLVVDGHSFVCRSRDCRLRFSVKDDIPVMLADEAQVVSLEVWTAIIEPISAVNAAAN